MRISDLIRFYGLINELERRLGQARILSDCHGRLDWPQRGVYFFREPGESRSDSGSGPRVVRVGTHALKFGSKTKLWTRLSQHRGQTRSGGGNHRGSIFRLIIGTALIKRDGHNFPTWGKGSSAPSYIRREELLLENCVSQIVGSMQCLWLPINDEPGPNSLRGYIERNAIALLSNHDKEQIDPASDNWLGRYCNRSLVKTSGMWNQNHVSERYDPAFLDVLENLIHETEHSE